MAIPKLPSYDLPRQAQFPESKVDWAFEPQRAVLLIHDMQRYFLDFYGEDSPLVRTLVANVVRLRAACRAQGIRVVYTAQPVDQSPEDRALLNDMWGRGIDNKPELQGIVPELAPEPGDLVLTKWRYSAFVRSDLERLLAEAKKDQLLIAGVYGHIGCLMTAAHAFMLDVKPFLVGDAVADFSLEDHLMSLRYVASRLGRVIGVREVERP